MKIARFLSVALICGLLTACGIMDVAPKPPPPVTDKAQQVVRAQTSTLTKLGDISVHVFGSPMDAEREIQRRADRLGAHYYYIIMVSETVMPGSWYSQAILYQ